LTIAQRFIAGDSKRCFSVRETDGWTELQQSIVASIIRPLHGLHLLSAPFPALKCWAINSRPQIADCKPLWVDNPTSSNNT